LSDQAWAHVVHESAHAVVARLLGHRVVSATLDGVTTQYLRANPNQREIRRLNLYFSRIERGRQHQQTLFNEAVIAAAGPAAELRLQPRSPEECKSLWEHEWAADRAKVERLPQAQRRAVAGQARALVLDCWPEIQVVAKALLERGSLTGDEVYRLIG
jgi:hypothetical protein